MIRTVSTFVTVLALALSGAIAWAEDTAADRLADILRSYSTFEASFSQTVMDSDGRVMQETGGELKAKRPGLFYWETRPPARQFIVSDGEHVTLYDPDLEQVTIQALDDQVAATPALLLSGETQGLSEIYEISEQRYGDRTREYTLVPRSEDSLFTSLTMIFYGDELQAMRMEDSLGQQTELEFGSVRINEPVPDSAFTLDYPEEVDVIQGMD
ncbi:outer membrane lipoprotein carrier protein [Marinobacter daqiaonensis]|uniref:Outer-membrane lipoprotein carrier protein n=1 Tax=Marinobacter daqiaonensis TaxID=650891 RepID=A0A1I6GW41_9GAMM|nr:outer membrane lipoprotein chaperone LolA [Marinobacter daqiaonensis]SFR46291.1 outer membrane lipoprotein carrier protein [Marinobacter daqiaonensis]